MYYSHDFITLTFSNRGYFDFKLCFFIFFSITFFCAEYGVRTAICSTPTLCTLWRIAAISTCSIYTLLILLYFYFLTTFVASVSLNFESMPIFLPPVALLPVLWSISLPITWQKRIGHLDLSGPGQNLPNLVSGLFHFFTETSVSNCPS